MVDHLLLARGIYALGALTAIGACGVLWRYRERTGALALLAMMGGMVIWSGSLLGLTVTDHATVAALALRTVFVGVAVVSVAKFAFVLEYTGREHLLRPRVLGPLGLPPVLLVVFAFTNPGELFFVTLEATDEGPLPIAFELGPATLVHLVYAYALNVAVTAMILGFLSRSRSIYRGQSLALLVGSIAPWIANAAYALEVVPFDATPVGGVVSGVLFAVAVVRYRLLDLMPIARERVLDNVDDGVFVVDSTDRLVDSNPAGRRLLADLGVETSELVGRSFPSLVDGTELRERYETGTSTRDGATAHASIGDRRFQVTLTPIDDGRDRRVGWLVIARDVTDRKRREERLERQNDRLERFASLVSHDLRNPLTVARGHLDLARETDEADGHLDVVAESHDRMETIIGDVLALAREGAAVTDPRSVELAALADRAWRGIDAGDATLDVRSDARIAADPERVQRLLENLFRNAIDHGTDDDAASGLGIAVGAIDGEDGSLAGFYVADDGIGIPACRRDRVFDDGYTTDAEGTGLGLSIVERIATAHHWSVSVAESESGGVRFEFTGVEAGSAVDSTSGSESREGLEATSEPP